MARGLVIDCLGPAGRAAPSDDRAALVDVHQRLTGWYRADAHALRRSAPLTHAKLEQYLRVVSKSVSNFTDAGGFNREAGGAQEHSRF